MRGKRSGGVRERKTASWRAGAADRELARGEGGATAADDGGAGAVAQESMPSRNAMPRASFL